MDFREGGRWHYPMVSPEGEKHWCLFDYEIIEPEQRYKGSDAFCDENQVIRTEINPATWDNRFEKEGKDRTVVKILIQFQELSDLEKHIAMGFKEGFAAGLENLDAYIASQFYLRATNKPNRAARTSSYVNFPGNTEAAFLFYQSVFKTEFVNGIHRFGEAPSDPANPMSDELKKLILHIELPLLGDHILMGTDAPKEMGFSVTQGNNLHINLEPDSREETKRIFSELSTNGTITMELQDMFCCAYFGSFTDQFGINWMVKFQNPLTH